MTVLRFSNTHVFLPAEGSEMSPEFLLVLLTQTTRNLSTQGAPGTILSL